MDAEKKKEAKTLPALAGGIILGTERRSGHVLDRVDVGSG
jgi:hypothetical protein